MVQPYPAIVVALIINLLFRNYDLVRADGDLIFTAYSAPILLASGEFFYADPVLTQLERPSGKIAIRRFETELVYENGDPAPLDEIYLHHISVFTERYVGPCPGTSNSDKTLDVLGSAYFAGGAETRVTGNEVTHPHAWIFENETFYATIHVVRTTMVEDVKSCIECHCWEGETLGGGVECCPHGSRCRMDLTQPGVNDTKAYYMKYSFLCSPVDDLNRDLAGDEVIPVDLMMFDSTDCETEYNIPQCLELWPASESCTHTQSMNYTIDDDYLVIGAVPHGHIGILSIEINIVDNFGELRSLCSGIPKYGTETGVPGNEKGYLVGMTSCHFDQETAVPIYNGDTLVVNAVYDSSESHDGVMAYFVLGTTRM
jgi:hypothetical protein